MTAVAEGLARLGHDVHVLVTPGSGPFPPGAVHWIAMTPPFGAKQLRWLRTGQVRRIVAAFEPHAIIERYYNFGGEGIMAGGTRAKTVLEVNAPVIDHVGSTKALIDRALLIEPCGGGVSQSAGRRIYRDAERDDPSSRRRRERSSGSGADTGGSDAGPGLSAVCARA